MGNIYEAWNMLARYECNRVSQKTFVKFCFYYGHMAIGPYTTNMGKWGIPEKSYKNVAQQC